MTELYLASYLVMNEFTKRDIGSAGYVTCTSVQYVADLCQHDRGTGKYGRLTTQAGLGFLDSGVS